MIDPHQFAVIFCTFSTWLNAIIFGETGHKSYLAFSVISFGCIVVLEFFT